MTLKSLNPSPRLPAELAKILTDPKDQYVMIDVGSRGASEEYAAWFKGMMKVIGFETDEEECARLNALHPDGSQISFPYVIAEKKAKRLFYVTRFPYSSGLHKGKPEWLSRIPWRNLDVLKEIEVTTVSLDSVVKKEGIEHIDFIKADVEGAELEVFRGAAKSLKDRAVLGIKTELWWDPISKGQPSFAELDIYLRKAGFQFFDLNLHYSYPRHSLPAGRLGGGANESDGSLRIDYVAQPYGQAATGDALYFRDPVGEKREGRQTIEWTDQNLLRLCGLLDAFDYGDCAIEILEEFRPQLSKRYDVDILIQAATPSIGGVVLAYEQYLTHSNNFRKTLNHLQYRDTGWEPKPRP